ncbi:MAG: carbohydrate kinase [Lachnospiraceae bacterium]|nr:carbohydrate kinase [Lachnospiraceae bacterium]
MKKLYAIGEALIDFIPQQTGVGIAEVDAFMPKVGGAPANVCGAYTKLGGPSAMITQLGADPFGDKIENELKHYGIDTSLVKRTEKANTSLAFVALKQDGNREFSFYRKPGADMLYNPEDVKKDFFTEGFALHFCSVSLGDFPMKEAHQQAVKYAREAGLLISFDPNLRKNLWASEEALRNAVLAFLPTADVLKVSDEEIAFITGKETIEEALPLLFAGEVKLVVYTEGAAGARAYTKHAKASAASEKVKAVDTTGAGDAFIGSFLYKLAEEGVTAETIGQLTEETLKSMLAFSNTYCGKSVQKEGAIASYPTKAEMG